MIFKKKADDIVEAGYAATTELLKENEPSKTNYESYRPVIIKPNIVTHDPPPTTTDVRVVQGIIKALKEYGIDEIAIAEGSGSGDTLENLKRLGYSKLGVRLIDIDKEKSVTLPVKNYSVWKELTIPQMLLNKFIISVPVLKDHSMCGVSISLKNMVGILPESHYSGYWCYKKSRIHEQDPHGCIADIISVIKPHWAIVDATRGMRGFHLCGTPIEPPLNLVYSSADPLEADRFGCSLLNKDWRDIPYLRTIADHEALLTSS
jgi:uncharacterized protein (DUF362 family)